MLVIKSGGSFHSVQVLRCKKKFKIVDLHIRSFICENESDFNQTFHIQDSFFTSCPTFPEEPTMDWSFGCLESHSPGSTTLLKTDFLLEKRFDKLSFDSGEEDLISSRLAGKTSIARPTEWSLMGTWRIPMSLCVSPSGDAEISFSGAKSALLSLNCWGERNLFIRWASFFVDPFSPIPTKREFAGEEAFILDASLNTSALASSLMPS